MLWERIHPAVLSCGFEHRMRGLLRPFNEPLRLLAPDGREVLQEFFKRNPVRQVLPEGINRDTGALKHGRAAHDFRVNRDWQPIEVVWFERDFHSEHKLPESR